MEIDLNKIRSAVHEKNSKTFYPELIKRIYSDNPDVILSSDFKLIYYGYAFQKDYITNEPSDYILDELKKVNDFEKIIYNAKQIIEVNPTNLRAIYSILYAYINLETPDADFKYMKYLNIYRSFLNVIALSGDGKSKGSAYHVLHIEDEYAFLYDYLNISKLINQRLIETDLKTYDVFEVEIVQSHERRYIYFDISLEYNKIREMIN